MTTPEDILTFWFPPGLAADQETHRRQFQWWFGGGADEAILRALPAGARGRLPGRAGPLGRSAALAARADHRARPVLAHGLASRHARRPTRRIPRAQHLALEGLERGHYAKLADGLGKDLLRAAARPCGAARPARALRRACARRWSTRRRRTCGSSMPSRRRRRAAIATSSRASAASPIATPCSAGPRPRRSSPTSPPASWSTGARSRAEPRAPPCLPARALQPIAAELGLLRCFLRSRYIVVRAMAMQVPSYSTPPATISSPGIGPTAARCHS